MTNPENPIVPIKDNSLLVTELRRLLALGPYADPQDKDSTAQFLVDDFLYYQWFAKAKSLFQSAENPVLAVLDISRRGLEIPVRLYSSIVKKTDYDAVIKRESASDHTFLTAALLLSSVFTFVPLTVSIGLITTEMESFYLRYKALSELTAYLNQKLELHAGNRFSEPDIEAVLLSMVSETAVTARK